MKQLFQENKNASLLLLGLFFFLLLTIYFLFSRPLHADLKQMENREKELKEDITLLQVKEKELLSNNEFTESDLENFRYNHFIPNTPELESLVLTLNEIELVTYNKLNSIDFSYDGSLPEIKQYENNEETSEENMEDHLNENDMENDEASRNENDADLDEEQNLIIDMNEIPDGLKLINLTLDVTSPDYEHFQLLLKEIEKQERKMFVTQINFNQPAEQELIFEEEEDTSILATINVTTFYYSE